MVGFLVAVGVLAHVHRRLLSVLVLLVLLAFFVWCGCYRLL